MSEPAFLHEIVPSGFFALRTPLLPFDELLAWSDSLETPSAGNDPVRLESAYAADRARLQVRLQAIFHRSEVREALFLASPGLEERLDPWLREEGDADDPKMERALVRYFARMAGRATPFGLFAGCSLGTVGEETRLVLADRAQDRRHTRLDMDYLVILTDALAREPDVRQGLVFGVNSSLYRTRDRFRYFEVRRNGKGCTHHHIVLEATDYLEATLARACAGASAASLVASLLDDDPDAANEEAEQYIGELIDNQVLISELRPEVTGPEPIEGLVTRLQERGITPAADRLERARQELEALDAGGLGAEPERYRHLARSLTELPGERDLARLFQVDLVKPVLAASLGPTVLDEIRRGVSLLHRLARPPRDDRLARFREAFVRRYEEREVPLVEALDDETGVGLDTLTGESRDASSLLDDLTFPKAAEETVTWGHRERFLLRKLSEALVSDACEVVIRPDELEALAESSPPPLPDSFAALVTIAAESEMALDRGEFLVRLDGASGPSGARLLGRFCHADPHLHQQVAQDVRAEEALRPDAAFAEIVHLPEGRVGNILARPILRDYEIPYLGRASVPPDRQIPVTDLVVSVVGEQVVLRSVRLGRRVLPRLSCAHHFGMSQGIYWFLCALQAQGTAGDLSWDWGPLRDAPFLPRVVSGKLVLSRATWHVSQAELRPFGQVRGAARFRAVLGWRAARRLPRWIAVVDGDNELPIDLDNLLAVETLVELIKGRDQATLVELFPGPDGLVARGPEGRFVHELVVPFVRRGAVATHPDRDAEAVVPRGSSPQHHATGRLRRGFPPGSEWLYAKLYAGPVTLDQLLRDVIQPIVASASGTGVVDRWFFVRFGDPEWHLRVRFHGQPARLHHELLPTLQAAAAPLIDDGRLWRIQLDTYEREVERYGGAEGIELAERLFHADSEAVLALTPRLAEDARGDVRWRIALLAMDRLLADLGFDLDMRRGVVRRARDAFAAALPADARFHHQLGTRFRPERAGLMALLDPTPVTDTPLAFGREVLRRRSRRLAPVLAELKACARAGRLTVPLPELAVSYLHMHANRLLRSAHRAQELVLYDFLTRLYESRAARAPRGASPVACSGRRAVALPAQARGRTADDVELGSGPQG
jgi:thiopeptide-type bacteriocin biosynthesis protein